MPRAKPRHARHRSDLSPTIIAVTAHRRLISPCIRCALSEKGVITMKKRILIGTLASIVASVGLWVVLGSAASAQPVTVRPAVAAVAIHAKAAATAAEDPSEDPSGPDTDTVQSGDQTSPDNGAAEGAETGTETEDSSTETDGVDCQQEGNFDGVNAAGTGSGCDGSGT
jgi:hypothetical protein